MEASDSGERKTVIMGKPLTSDMVLKTVGALALMLFGFSLNKTWEKIEDIDANIKQHESRLIKSEVRQDQMYEAVQEIKADVKDVKRVISKP